MDLSKNEIVDILKDNSINDELFSKADEIRKEFVGDEVHLRALIEFSNICKSNCKYCGLRSENKNIERYRLSLDDILKATKNAVNLGYKTVVLQSGEDYYYSADVMCEIIKKIKEFDIALTLSIGERSREDFDRFKDCGADRYLIRIETTDRNLYSKMHPHMDFENRMRCLMDLKELGYETGTGCLVGLEGQTLESLADDILFFKELDADMIGIGPFISHPDTPLNNAPNGDFWLSMKVMALTRIIMKNINIPATTAMETLHQNGRMIALQSGANVIMPNVTIDDFSLKYQIYPNKESANLNPNEYRNILNLKLKSIGREISTNYGFRNF